MRLPRATSEAKTHAFVSVRLLDQVEVQDLEQTDIHIQMPNLSAGCGSVHTKHNGAGESQKRSNPAA